MVTDSAPLTRRFQVLPRPDNCMSFLLSDVKGARIKRERVLIDNIWTVTEAVFTALRDPRGSTRVILSHR